MLNQMIFRRYQASLPSVILSFVLLSCGGGEEGQRASLVRINDLVHDARIDSPVDLSQTERVILDGSSELLSEVMADLPEARTALQGGGWVSDVLVDGSSSEESSFARIHWLAIPDNRREVRIRLSGLEGDQGRLFVVPVPEGFKDGAFRDATYAEKVFRYFRQFLLRGKTNTGGGSEEVEELFLRLKPEMKGLLVAVVGDPLLTERARLEVISPRSGAARLLLTSSTGSSPWLHRVQIDGVVCESVLLPTPARFETTVPIPDGDPLFTCSLARKMATSAGSVHVVISFSAEGKVVERTLEVSEAGSWQDVQMDLTEIGGEDALLSVSTMSEGDRTDGSFLAMGAAMVGASDRESRPDVILISLDTVRADYLSIYGGNDVVTPSVERLAETSFVFDQAIAAAPWTLPSHATVFSGLYPDRHGVHLERSQIPTDLPWLVDDFRRAGYVTEGFTGGGYLSPTFGFSRSFDRYGVADVAFPGLAWARARGDAAEIRRAQGSLRARRALVDVIREPSRSPLFLFVHTYAAHNYAAPPGLMREMGLSDADLDEFLRGLSTVDLMNQISRDPSLGEDDALISRARFLYRASVRIADDLLGEVLDALEESGRLDQSIIVVFSDHGEELFERGAIGHAHSTYEELVHVPLLVMAPGLKRGRVGDVVSLVDLAPTILELAGISGDLEGGSSVGSDGRSLVPLLEGGRLSAIPALVHGSREMIDRDRIFRALRGMRLKFLLEEGATPGDGELYVLDEDPGELTNVASSHGGEVKKLSENMKRMVEALSLLRSAGTEASLSPEIEARLRELGYLGGE